MKLQKKSYVKLLFIIISIFTLSFFTKCKESQNIEDLEVKGNTTIDIDLLKNDTNNLYAFTKLIENPKIISLKSKDTSFFLASIDKLIICNKNIFILDDRFSNLLKFDSSGYFVHNYGKIGLGINEYSKINDYDIDTLNKWVIIFSNSNKSLFYYSLETGKFIKKVNIKLFGSQISALNNNQIMLYRNFSNDLKQKEKDYNIIIIDSVGKAIKRAFPFNSSISFIEWRSSGFLKSTVQGLFFMNPFSDTVFQFQNNSFVSKIKTNILSDNIRKIREDHDKLFKSNIMLDTISSYMGSTFLKNERYIIFDFIKDRRIKTVYYDTKKNTYQSTSTKFKTDPYISLALTPIYLENDNTVYFKFTLKDLLKLKTKYPELFNKLLNSNKAIINDLNQKSGVFLLVGKIKNN